VAWSMNGCGTSVYGKRDFEPDGSFMTTKWVIAFFIPVLPLASMRVKVLDLDWSPVSSTRYLVCSKQSLSLKQVACVYSFLLLLFLTLASSDLLPTPATVVLLAAVFVFPWVLRRLARARGSQPTQTTRTLL